MLSKPIFIMGAHKSGTTLLRCLFDGTDDLCVIPFEPHIFEHLGFSINYGGRKARGENNNTESIKNNLIRYIETVNFENDIHGGNDANSQINLKIAKKFILQINQNDNYIEIIEKYYNSIRHSLVDFNSRNNKRILDKSVENSEFAILLKSFFPDAKFIHIIKNPYSNLVSIRRFKSRFGFPSLYKALALLKDNYGNLHNNIRTIKDYKVVKYEELVKEPEKVMRDLCDFCDLDYSDNNISPTVLSKNWFSNSTYNTNSNIIDKSMLNKWVDTITNLEIHLINKLFKYELDYYNYKKIKTKKSIYFPEKKEGLKVYLANRIYFRLLK